MKGYFKKIASSVLPILALAVLLVFVIYHIVLLVSKGAETVLAQPADESITRALGGYFFRDETVIFAEDSDYFVPTVSDGERVGAGKTVAVGVDKSGNEVYAATSEAGYYYSVADGYEYAFSGDKAKSLTYKNYADVVGAKAADVSGAAGKVATSFKWYLACTEPSADDLTVGATYEVSFGSVSVKMALMTLDKGDDGVLLVFESMDVPSDMKYERYMTAIITIPIKNAAYVPTKAIHEQNGAYFVYTFEDGFARRHEIKPIYNRDDLTVISSDEKIAGSFVIIGNGLYDGKAMHR